MGYTLNEDTKGRHIGLPPTVTVISIRRATPPQAGKARNDNAAESA
jgi:hypothetical protein